MAVGLASHGRIIKKWEQLQGQHQSILHGGNLQQGGTSVGPGDQFIDHARSRFSSQVSVPEGGSQPLFRPLLHNVLPVNAPRSYHLQEKVSRQLDQSLEVLGNKEVQQIIIVGNPEGHNASKQQPKRNYSLPHVLPSGPPIECPSSVVPVSQTPNPGGKMSLTMPPSKNHILTSFQPPSVALSSPVSLLKPSFQINSGFQIPEIIQRQPRGLVKRRPLDNALEEPELSLNMRSQALTNSEALEEPVLINRPAYQYTVRKTREPQHAQVKELAPAVPNLSWGPALPSPAAYQVPAQLANFQSQIPAKPVVQLSRPTLMEHISSAPSFGHSEPGLDTLFHQIVPSVSSTYLSQ